MCRAGPHAAALQDGSDAFADGKPGEGTVVTRQLGGVTHCQHGGDAWAGRVGDGIVARVDDGLLGELRQMRSLGVLVAGPRLICTQCVDRDQHDAIHAKLAGRLGRDSGGRTGGRDSWRCYRSRCGRRGGRRRPGRVGFLARGQEQGWQQAEGQAPKDGHGARCKTAGSLPQGTCTRKASRSVLLVDRTALPAQVTTQHGPNIGRFRRAIPHTHHASRAQNSVAWLRQALAPPALRKDVHRRVGLDET